MKIKRRCWPCFLSSKHKTVFLISVLVCFVIAFSGCINSPTPTPKVYGYTTTIVFDETKTELIDLTSKYDKYDIENNVGTANSRGYSYQTHKVTLWSGDAKKTINNVIDYKLTTVVASPVPKLKVYGFVTTITTDEKTTLIKFSDNYDKYEMENNVGTISYRGHTHQTHRITLWRGDTKKVMNNVVAYDLGKHYI